LQFLSHTNGTACHVWPLRLLLGNRDAFVNP
jgi:hypothetical protein